MQSSPAATEEEGKGMKVPKMKVVDNFAFLLFFCICAAVIMTSFIDRSLKFTAIALIVLGVVSIAGLIYINLRMMSDLSLLKPIKLFARILNGLSNLKRLDTNTRAWVIGILALCLLSMGFVYYVSFQNAAGVMPYAFATGVFTVIGIVFLHIIGKKT